jgi:hypothetical protein
VRRFVTLIVMLLGFVLAQDAGTVMRPYLRLYDEPLVDELDYYIIARSTGMSDRHSARPMLSLSERFYPALEQGRLVLEQVDGLELTSLQDAVELIVTIYRQEMVIATEVIPLPLSALPSLPEILLMSGTYPLTRDMIAARDYQKRICAIVTATFLAAADDPVVLNNCPHSPL